MQPDDDAVPGEPLRLHGALRLAVGGRSLGGADRIGLLRAVGDTGSITHAARAVGLSYKAAWDAVDAMNNAAGAPLVERQPGGRGGGGTRLTEHGRRLVARHAELEALHQSFIGLLDASGADLGRDLDLWGTLNMKTSARNQFTGTVSRVAAGAVNDEVEIDLRGGRRLVAVVTRESAEALGLAPGVAAFALVKASSVLVATQLGAARLSARNQLAGTVARVLPGAVNAEVVVDLGDGLTLAAVVTRESVAALGLAAGVSATALFKASSVIVGVAA